MPRAKLKPTEEQRRQVRSLSALGVEPYDIARYFHVSEKTLRKYYKDEIFRGPLEANAKVAQSLFEMATAGESALASIFWSKARAGWCEKQGRDVQPAVVPDFIVALDKKAA